MEALKQLLQEAASFLNHPTNGQSLGNQEAAEDLRNRIAQFLTASPVQELTYGMKHVGLTFNPGGMPEVNEIKQASADLIDVLNDQRAKCDKNSQKWEDYTDAIKMVKTAQMWGAKAATWPY